MSGSFSVSSEGIRTEVREFTQTARKMDPVDRFEKTQNAPADFRDSISFSGGASFRVDQAKDAVEANLKLQPTEQELSRSPLNVMV
jgi:hypothetical protein